MACNNKETRRLKMRLRSQRQKAIQAIMVWAHENEEPARDGWTMLRKEKRAQLRTAKGHVWRQLGPGSMDASILWLLLESKAFPEVDPADRWIEDAATWLVTQKWTDRDVAVMVHEAREALLAIRSTYINRDGKRGWRTVLDFGEGWGSIGTAAAQIQLSTIGIDRAGTLYQGQLYGYIRARVQMDFALNTGKNLLRKIVKKAGIALDSVLMVWLSPECTLLSRANTINLRRGCAHGPYAEDPVNIAAATPERINEERIRFQDCKRSVEEQMRALEEEDVLFALENPVSSHFWELEAVTSRVDRMSSRGWTIHRVDQCAYGRQARKETQILTNIKWCPKGLTGTGRCVIGKCSGTLGSTPGEEGAGKHLQQTLADGYGTRTRVGDNQKGRRGEYSVQAAKNRVVPMLVQEIMQAAVSTKRKRE